MRKIFLLFVLLISISCLSAQHTIHTKITDKNTLETLEFVSVRLLQSGDSALISGVTTDSTGIVKLQNIKSGSYILNARLVGYTNLFQNVNVAGKDVHLPDLEMEEDSNMLKELEVRGTQVQVVTKGDTIEYNAAAFKTSENAVVRIYKKKCPVWKLPPKEKLWSTGKK